MSEQRVHVLGHEVRVSVRPGDGSGPPPVLCNGIGAAFELLEPFVNAVGPRIEVVCFDVLGVGDSPTPKVPYRFAGQHSSTPGGASAWCS